MIRAESIVFWILILTVIGVVIWLAFGSPDFERSLLMIMIFVAGSEILLWKFLFKIDKKTAIGFEKIKGDFKIIKKDVSEIKDNIIQINKKLKVK